MRFLKWFGVLGALGLFGASAASATAPLPSRHYKGHGPDYENNTPHWTKGATGHFSFDTSSDGTRITNFSGSFSYYCGGGTANVTATFIKVHPDGSYQYRFTVQKQFGIDYVKIWGGFLSSGSKAKVRYLVDFVATGQHVHHPYSTKHPRKLGCASWVRGTAHVT